MQQITFRPFAFTDADYDAVVTLSNEALPDYAERVDDSRHWDETRPDFCTFERWVAEADGALVAQGGFYHSREMFHPQKFSIDLCVHPRHQGQGIGQRLYAHLMERIAPFRPITLRSEAREDFAAANHLLRKHGYAEEMRFWESRLDVAAFDPSRWAGQAAKVRARDITIVTLHDLMAQGEAYRHPLYEAIVELARDVPGPDEYTPPTFEQWQKDALGSPELLPEGYFIALHQGAIAGISQLWSGAEPDVLYTGLTATRADYRRMGIALALKLQAIDFARARGIREIRTGNETRNRAMLSINEALGFVKQPVWVAYARHL